MLKKIKDYLKLIRVKHYIKNALIFLPLIFGKLYYDVHNIVICLLGFFLFSFSCSIIYVFNDICDIEKDRKHEIKKNRPLASGRISITQAYVLMAILFILDGVMIYVLSKMNINMSALLLVLFYIILNLLYSKWLKHIILVDVIVLVLGFLIRLYFGALLIGVQVSNWLYLTIMSGAFYMGFGKRRNEIIQNKAESREVLKRYNKEFLDKSMYVCLTLTIVFYAMWAVDPTVIANVHHNYLIWTVPLVLIILFEYSLAIEKDSYGDPVEVLTSSKSMLLTVLLYCLAILYIWV